MSLTRSRLLAACLAAALGVGGAALVPTQADAVATRQVTVGSADWGYKESFRTYIAEEIAHLPNGSQVRSSITPSSGAVFVGNVPSNRKPSVNKAPYAWTATGGSVNPSSGAGSVSFDGKVTFTYPNHFIQRFSIANPRVVLNGNGGGGIYVDISYDTGGGGGQPASTASKSDVKIATLTNANLSTSGDRATLTNAAASLTAAGSAAVNGFSAAGDPLDPISFSVALKTTAASTPTKSGSGSATSSGTGSGSGSTAKSTTKASAGAGSTASSSAPASSTASASASASAKASSSPGATSTSSVAGAPSGAATDAPSTEPQASTQPTGSSGPSAALWLVLALLALAAAAGATVIVRRRGSTATAASPEEN